MDLCYDNVRLIVNKQAITNSDSGNSNNSNPILKTIMYYLKPSNNASILYH